MAKAKRERARVWDVIIIGAGPAGLSAALVLGRCCRSVLLCDRGTPRSWASRAMHSFITRDGIPPDVFRSKALAELAQYSNIQFCPGEAHSAAPSGPGFRVKVDTATHRCRKLLIATGVMDQLPDIDGFEAAFGTSVFQCPYCDGWEVRGRKVVVYGRRQRGFEMARAITAWSRDVVLCTHGPARFQAEQLRQLAKNGIRLEERRIARLEVSPQGVVSQATLVDGTQVPCEAVFFDTPSRAQSTMTEQLGCSFNRHGGVRCGKYEATSVPGVYVAGNIIRNVQLSIVAAAEGANAAFGINRALTREDFARPVRRRSHGN